MDVVLLVIGVASEFVGIVLLGFPDLLPGAIRLSVWLRRQGRRAANVIRRLAGRPPRAFVIDAEAGSYATFGFSASGMVGPGPDVTTIEDKIEYLLGRDQNAQRDLNALASRVAYLETESPKELAEARQEMEQHVARAN
jgi:hypothetical protein